MEKILFDNLSKEEQNLVRKAREASTHYHNPEGTHYVGAALMTKDGHIFEGAAIRRQSASSNSCSERVAIDQAIYNGEHNYRLFATIGLNKKGERIAPIFPCGLCRQIIYEFYPEAKTGSFLVANSEMTEVTKTDIHELLPASYKH